MSKEGSRYGCVPADVLSVPSTVDELSGSGREETITVLDLSDPKDMAMFLEIKDRCTTTQSQCSLDSDVSFDAMSLDMEDMPDLDTKAPGKDAASQVVKQELRLRIQAKRFQNGQDVTPVCDTTKKVCRIEQLTAEEEERRKLRRERNKLAAQKCRSKRQARVEQLEMESKILITKNETLKEQIEKLQAEKEMLCNMVKTHDMCPRTCNTCLSTSSEEETSHQNQGDVLDPDELSVGVEFVIESSESVSPFSAALVNEVVDEPLFLE